MKSSVPKRSAMIISLERKRIRNENLEDYKRHVKSIDSDNKRDMEEIYREGEF